MTDDRQVQRSGGGIVSRGGQRSDPRALDPGDVAGLMRAWRRRWTTGVAIATTATGNGMLRGITLTSVLSLSLDPPLLAFGLVADGEFAAVLRERGRCCVQILQRGQEFLADRFSGRAPLPDAAFHGIPHQVVEGVPVIHGSLAWSIGRVERMDAAGDHLLVMLKVTQASVGEDSDDPLLSYEGRYRGLEAS